ncbi:lamin-L(III)-like isoform X1 [Podarcis raffonei]|uniref:lamin-L(III)-like isoform X1 n=1 Tax=Podarcis raffonei TaxID=65483 RepID=UPI0023296593|nr:lamin-L(III)-like isoform X1 [Podarcis raffonei]
MASPDSGLGDDSFSSPLLPAPPSILQQELRQLNDRLAAYLPRVRGLEATRTALQLRLSASEEGSRREVGVLRRAYERELAAVREELHGQVRQRAGLQVELETLSEKHRQLLARNSKNENDLSLAVARVKDLDAQLRCKEAELTTSLSRQQSLQNHLQESVREISSLKVMVNHFKSHLQNELLKRTDIENQMETLKKEVIFLKNIHEDELKNKKQIYESRIREIESHHHQELESRLLNALKELRQQHEQQICAYKDQVQQNFSAKMENIQRSAARSSDITKAAEEELREAKLRVDSLMSQVATLEARNGDLEARINTLENTILDKQGSSRRCLAEKDREMDRMHQRMQAQLGEHVKLLDMKMGLDLEIGAYRAMLEGEEQRLKNRPSSESVGTLASTSLGSPVLPRRRRRKRALSECQVHSVCFKTVQHASSSGSISIEHIDKEGQFVKIRNNSDQEQSLSGWTTRRQHGNQSEIMYEFPARCTLGAGQVLTIWGVTESSSPAPGMLVWKSPKSMRGGDSFRIVLFDSAGNQMAEGKLTYVDCGEGDGEMEVAAGEERMERHIQAGFLHELQN